MKQDQYDKYSKRLELYETTVQRYEDTFHMICINRNRVLVLLSTFCMLLLIMISEGGLAF
jgi:hypothetical protein